MPSEIEKTPNVDISTVLEPLYLLLLAAAAAAACLTASLFHRWKHLYFSLMPRLTAASRAECNINFYDLDQHLQSNEF